MLWWAQAWQPEAQNTCFLFSCAPGAPKASYLHLGVDGLLGLIPPLLVEGNMNFELNGVSLASLILVLSLEYEHGIARLRKRSLPRARMRWRG